MILLECCKTGRYATCADELSAKREVKRMGLTDYTTSPVEGTPTPSAVQPKRQRIMRAVGSPVRGMEIVE